MVKYKNKLWPTAKDVTDYALTELAKYSEARLATPTVNSPHVYESQYDTNDHDVNSRYKCVAGAEKKKGHLP